jgi:hypothetical protein
MRQEALSERFTLASRGAAGTEWQAQCEASIDILVHSSGDTWTRRRPHGEWMQK